MERLVENQLKEIEKGLERVNKKEEQIKELTFEKNLIKTDLVEKVKELEYVFETRYTAHTRDLFDLAYGFYCNESEGKQPTKEQIEAYIGIKSLLEMVFFENPDDFKLTDIIAFNYPAWAYDLYYEYKSKKIILRIPMFESACENNVYYLIQGYSLYEQQKPHVQEQLISSFDTDKIKQAIEEWKKGNKGIEVKE